MSAASSGQEYVIQRLLGSSRAHQRYAVLRIHGLVFSVSLTCDDDVMMMMMMMMMMMIVVVAGGGSGFFIWAITSY